MIQASIKRTGDKLERNLCFLVSGKSIMGREEQDKEGKERGKCAGEQ